MSRSQRRIAELEERVNELAALLREENNQKRYLEALFDDVCNALDAEGLEVIITVPYVSPEP